MKQSLTKRYDELNRTDAIFDGLAPALVDFHYVGPTRIQAMDFGNMTRQNFTYDGLTGVPNPPGDFGSLRAVASTVAPIGGGPAVEAMTYAYDRAGNTTARIVNGTATDEDYQYDAANRLTRTDRAAAPLLTTYTFDGANNRTSVGGGLDAGPYTRSTTTPAPADAQVNQYTATPFDTRSYDANGNLITMTPTVPAGPTKMLVYDYRNRLVQYTDPATATSATYRYDNLGRRTESAVASAGPVSVVKYFYDGQHEIEERDGTGAVVLATIVRGPGGKAVQAVRGGVPHTILSDCMNSPVVILTAGGAVIERYAYTEYGQATIRDAMNQIVATSLCGNPFRWAGSRLAAESGLLLHQREYCDVRSAQPVSGNPMLRPARPEANLLLPDPSVFEQPTLAENILEWIEDSLEQQLYEPVDLGRMYDQMQDFHQQALDSVMNRNAATGITLLAILGYLAEKEDLYEKGRAAYVEAGETVAYNLVNTDGDPWINLWDIDDDGDDVYDEDETDSDGDDWDDGVDSAPNDPNSHITAESEGGVWMLSVASATRDVFGMSAPYISPMLSASGAWQRALSWSPTNTIKSPRQSGPYGLFGLVPITRGLVNPYNVQGSAPLILRGYD